MANAGIRILFVGIAMSGSSVTRVLTALMANFPEQYEIHFLGAYRSESLQIEISGLRFYPWPDSIRNPAIIFYLQQLIREIRPRILFMMGYPWWFSEVLEVIAQPPRDFRTILYMPIEGYLVDIQAIKPLRYIDHCLLYSQFAYQNIETLGRQLEQQDPNFKLPQLQILPHGVNTESFFPIQKTVAGHFSKTGRALIRGKLFPDRPELNDAVIILNANQPYPRKRIDLTIQSLGLFLQRRPAANIYLYLHHPHLEAYFLRQIMSCAGEMGITQRLLVNTMNTKAESISDDQLNDLYNACDIGINTAMGEGWGLVSFEHAATGAAQLIPNHTTFKEIWADAAVMMDIASEEYLGYEHAKMYVVSPEDAAAKIERLYDNEAYRYQMSLYAYERATSPQYLWPSIAGRLSDIFRSVLTNCNL